MENSNIHKNIPLCQTRVGCRSFSIIPVGTNHAHLKVVSPIKSDVEALVFTHDRGLSDNIYCKLKIASITALNEDYTQQPKFYSFNLLRGEVYEQYLPVHQALIATKQSTPVVFCIKCGNYVFTCNSQLAMPFVDNFEPSDSNLKSLQFGDIISAITKKYFNYNGLFELIGNYTDDDNSCLLVRIHPTEQNITGFSNPRWISSEKILEELCSPHVSISKTLDLVGLSLGLSNTVPKNSHNRDLYSVALDIISQAEIITEF